MAQTTITLFSNRSVTQTTDWSLGISLNEISTLLQNNLPSNARISQINLELSSGTDYVGGNLGGYANINTYVSLTSSDSEGGNAGGGNRFGLISRSYKAYKGDTNTYLNNAFITTYFSNTPSYSPQNTLYTRLTLYYDTSNWANKNFKCHYLRLVVDYDLPYTITLNANGGTISSNSVLRYSGDTYGDLPIPSPPVGHYFTFWATSLNTSDRIYSQNVVPNQNITLYAHYGVYSYNLYYYANDGTDNYHFEPVYFGQDYTVKSGDIFTRKGYNFDGWYNSNNVNYPVGITLTYYDIKDMSLYAHWKAKEITVYFNPDGGTLFAYDSMTYYYDNVYTLIPTPKKYGYTFLGWYLGDILIKQDETKVSTETDHTLIAKWAAKTPTITFNVQGGNTTHSPQTVTYGSPYGELPTPTRTGYTFNGWEYRTNIITSTTIVATETDHTLTAVWKADKYKVTFISDGNVISTTDINYGDKYSNFPTVNKEGYTFNGWKNANGATITSNSDMLITEDHSLTAEWIPFSYTIIFNGNGDDGTGAMTQQSFKYQQNQSLTKNIFSKPNYKFIGWNTAIDGTGDNFSDEQQMKDFKPSSNGQIITLYAQWLLLAIQNIKIDDLKVVGALLDTTKIIKIFIDKILVYGS